MGNGEGHDIMAVELEDGIPTDDVSLATLRSGLESEDNVVRSQAATVAAGLATEAPEQVTGLLSRFFELLQDDQRIVVYQTLSALTLLAEDHASEFDPVVPRLVDLLSSDLPMIEMLTARTLARVAVDRPELFTEYVDELVATATEEPSDVVEPESMEESPPDVSRQGALEQINREGRSRQILTRQIAANVLVEVAEHDPSAVEGRVSTFVELLSDRDGNIVVPSTRVLGSVAREHPESVTGAVEPLCDLLEHPDETVAANAVTSLGFIEDDDAVEPLRELARGGNEGRRDEDLHDLAAETAEFIDQTA